MAKSFFSSSEQEQITSAIKHAELNTSGEIRVHIETVCKEDVLDKAVEIFHRLEMDKTQLNNGVLVFLSVQDKKIGIIGGKGIDEVVTADFWNSTKDLMIEHFKKGELANGLIAGIKEAGDQLKAHFPYTSNDVNELPDEISFGE